MYVDVNVNVNQILFMISASWRHIAIWFTIYEQLRVRKRTEKLYKKGKQMHEICESDTYSASSIVSVIAKKIQFIRIVVMTT